MNDWTLGNELLINIKKTEYVLFGTFQKLNQARTEDVNGEVCLGDEVLARVPNYKYLIVYLDQTLTFKEHITK